MAYPPKYDYIVDVFNEHECEWEDIHVSLVGTPSIGHTIRFDYKEDEWESDLTIDWIVFEILHYEDHCRLRVALGNVAQDEIARTFAGLR